MGYFATGGGLLIPEPVTTPRQRELKPEQGMVNPR